MTPKEKAEELIMKMYYAQDESLRWTDDAKRCAMVAVDEILKSSPYLPSQGSMKEYWEEVKQELLKL